MSDDEEEQEVTYEVVFEDEPDKPYNYLPAKDGKASATFSNGDTYSGLYKDGKRTGKGTYTFKGGAAYDGEYFDNMKHGFGRFKFPDGGIYTGNWNNDLRHGQGTYVYPNKDVYEGMWKEGAKHGKGTYTYAVAKCTISGDWSNGKCVDGVWTYHDSSKFMGSFLSNSPAGDGAYSFVGGNKVSGFFADNKFKAQPFVKPHPTAPEPAERQADQFTKACRLLDKAVVRLDHFGTMQRVKANILEGVPNWRKTASKAPLYACGQPTQDGYKKIQETLAEQELENVVVVNLRDEPLVYVNGQPFAPRDKKNLGSKMELGMSLEELGALEERLMQNVRFNVKKKGQVHDYREQVEGDFEAKQLIVPDAQNIRSPDKLFTFMTEEEELSVTAKRFLLHQGLALEQVDSFMALARPLLEGGAAVVFNDADGTGAAQTALTLAGLLKRCLSGPDAVEEGEEEEEAAEEEADEGDEGDGGSAAKVPAEPQYDPFAAPDLAKGEYAAVMAMCRALVDPAYKPPPPPEAEAEAKEGDEGDEVDEDEKEDMEEEARAAAEAAKEAEEARAAEANEGDEGEGDGEAKAEEPTEAAVEPPKKPYGVLLKEEVDEVLAACGELRNVRDAVGASRKEGDDEAAKVHLVQYFKLILVAAYLKAQVQAEKEASEAGEEGGEEAGGAEDEDGDEGDAPATDPPAFKVSFQQWRDENAELEAILAAALEAPEFVWAEAPVAPSVETEAEAPAAEAEAPAAEAAAPAAAADAPPADAPVAAPEAAAEAAPEQAV